MILVPKQVPSRSRRARPEPRLRPLAVAGYVLGLAVLVSVAACEPAGGVDMAPTRDMAPDNADLTTTLVCDGGGLVVPDLGGVDLAASRTIPAGGVGAACTATTDCTEGKGERVCWRDTLLNNPKGTRTPGGYCSASCTRDTDCGANNYCVSFAPMGGLFCVAGCSDPSTCRKSDYLCTYLDTVNACLPRLPQLTCDPKASAPCTVTAVPMDPMSPKSGACVRQALEDGMSGICYPTCAPGDSCGSDAMGQDLACRFLDTIRSGDGFRGTLCTPISPRSTTQGLGAPCTYSDDCQAGFQCDSDFVRTGATGRCLPLCRTTGGGPACPVGYACQDTFGTCGGAGLCRPR